MLGGKETNWASRDHGAEKVNAWKNRMHLVLHYDLLKQQNEFSVEGIKCCIALYKVLLINLNIIPVTITSRFIKWKQLKKQSIEWRWLGIQRENQYICLVISFSILFCIQIVLLLRFSFPILQAFIVDFFAGKIKSHCQLKFDFKTAFTTKEIEFQFTNLLFMCFGCNLQLFGWRSTIVNSSWQMIQTRASSTSHI